MKKKLLIALLAITSAVCSAVAFTACNGDSENGSAQNEWGTVYTYQAAYAEATELGYSGSLEEFIALISGKDGKDGIDGKDGKGGADGFSAFEIYLKYHPDYKGTEQEWIESLKGADGINGENSPVLDEAYIDDGDLILVLTNGNVINCGKVRDDRPIENFQYTAVKTDGQITGYNIIGLGNVSDMDIVIPAEYNGKPVLNIAFDSNEKQLITSVVLSDGITNICTSAFSGYTNLESVKIPDSVTTIGERAFLSCSNLKSITIPGSVTSIGGGAFNNCINIESILVDKENKFYHSAGNCLIETESKTLILGCKNSEIPTDGSVTSIGASAFSKCLALTTITIPESITYIGAGAFYECGSLTDIYYNGNYEQWQAIEKGGLWASTGFSTVTLHCSDGDYTNL